MSQPFGFEAVEQRLRGFAPRRRLATLALGLVVLLGFCGSASAAGPGQKLIWGPPDAKSFEIYDDLDADLYEMAVNWSRVAPARPAAPADPNDPAYKWPYPVELAIQNAIEHDIEVVVAISGAPRWANGSRPWRFAPRNPRDYADFVTAASKRWPEVRFWSVWGEPVRRLNFMPLPKQVEDLGLNRRQSRGVVLYARILDAAYGALKAVNPGNIVIGGNSFSGGDVPPITFIKELRLPNGKPPRMDLYGHNPFGGRRPDLSKDQLAPEIGVADFSDLDVLARYVDRYLSRAGRNRHTIRLFLHEYFLPTDHPNTEFDFWVTRKTAASWLRSAFEIAHRWKRIHTLGWFSLYDDPPDGKGTEVNRGLLTHKGAKKPAYFAFKEG